jgi:hypothetical protein
LLADVIQRKPNIVLDTLHWFFVVVILGPIIFLILYPLVCIAFDIYTLVKKIRKQQ